MIDFSTIFDEADFSAWVFRGASGVNSIRDQPYIGGYGIDGGPSNTCNRHPNFTTKQGSLAYTFQEPSDVGWSEISIRAQYAILRTSGAMPSFVFSVNDSVTGGSIMAAYLIQISLTVLSTGAIRLYFADGFNGSTTVDSASGVVPLDGTIHGYQLVVTNVTAAAFDYEVVFDNDSVLSGNYTPVNGQCNVPPLSWGYFTSPGTCANFTPHGKLKDVILAHAREPRCGPATMMTNCAEFIVDTVGAVVDYPACNAPQLTADACPDVTALTFDCDNHKITVTGVNLDDALDAGELLVTGPTMGPSGLDVTVESVTPTAMVITVGTAYEASFTEGEQYCVQLDDLHCAECAFMVCESSPTPDPVPSPTPSAPLTPCTPDAQVTGGGKGKAGCNVGGVGFTPSVIADYGEVPQHDDPADGETLTGKDHASLEAWIELVHVDYPSGVPTTHRRAFVELADAPSYEGGRKRDGLLALADVENALGNEQGSFEAASGDIELSDMRDRLIRGLAEDQELDGDEVYVKVATDDGRAAGVAPRVLLRGIVQQAQLGEGLRSRLSFVDWLFSDFGPFGPDRKWPPLFSDLGRSAPDLTADVASRAIPSLFGELSDEGAVDPLTSHPSSKGLIPVHMLGWFTVDGLRMGFLALGLGEWSHVVGGYGSDLGEGVEGQTPNRVKFDLASRGDLFTPGWHWPADQVLTPYVSIIGNVVRFTNPDTGIVFDLFGVFATGPVLTDHLHDVINYAFNAIGRMDAEGRPVMHSARVQQYWLENDVLNRWTSGDLASEDDFPQFADGVPKVRSSSFAAMQAIYDDLFGGPAVLSWYVDQQQSTLDVVRQMNLASESRLGVNEHGQLMLWGLDVLSDPSTWPRINHVTDLYGPITRTSGVERENVVSGSCDWDPDAERFRVAGMTVESAPAIEQYKGRRKVGNLIESRFYNQPIGLYWVLQRRLARLKQGMTMIDVTGPRTWLDQDVGAGVLLTTEDGPGASGYVDRPCVIMRRRTNLKDHLVTYTLWDVGDLIVAGVTDTSGDDLLAITATLSDDDDESASLSDVEAEAAVLV